MNRSHLPSRLTGLVVCLAFVQFAPAQVGPDVIVKLEELTHYGRLGPIGQGVIGAAIGTTSCNAGDEPVNWFQLPDIDHPVFPSNFYRLMTVEGSTRFEQIGQSWVKHGRGTEDADECGFGCTPPPPFFSGRQLGVGCTDTYGAGQSNVSCDLSPRSALNPYTGVMAGGDDMGACSGFSVLYPSRDHRGHNHNAISHTTQIRDVDLMAGLNPGARYFGESQYIAPHEYVDGNGNQNNNVVHREYRVAGPDERGGYFFPHVGEPVSEEPALNAWPGSSISMIEPAPLMDGRAFLACQTTDLGGGIWHYEYALYNMNLDRALESLSIPIGSGATLSNVGFHAPLNQPHVTHADNYSNEPWDVAIASGAITWATESFAANYLANAVTWGTLYNFRFDANAPPQAVSGTVGLFKTGDTATVAAVGPSAVGASDCNSNSIDDACDLSCDPPGCAVPGCGESDDCTGNGIPDECEADCQPNGVADSCDLAAGTSEDCNRNGIPDECDPGGLSDCNANQNNDICDLATGTSEDFNQNGVPDECDPHLGVIHVDDNAPGDPSPGDPADSDPLEDGSIDHPFDSIQEAIDVALIGDVVLVADGVYTGEGNFNISFGGRSITVRSANGPTNCMIDVELQGSGFVFDHGEKEEALIDGFTIIHAAETTPGGRFGIRQAGVKCEGGGPSITNCVIKLCEGNPIRVERSTVRFVNCVVHDNASTFRVVRAMASLQNCTLANTSIPPLSLFDAQVTVTNSIIRTSSGLGEGISVFAPPSSVVDVTYSNIEGGWPGVGNVDVDPIYGDEVGGDFRLASTSPCIDAGDTSGVCALTDLLGAPRHLDDPDTADTGVTVGGAPVVDMGATEYVPPDCNDNGVPDDQDISGSSLDANGNGIPDECEHDFDDCNGNSLPDICEPDCNANGIADECDITGPTSSDCNGNGIPDECEAGWDQDCDGAGATDLCDIADGTSQDCNGNGIPDECEVAALPTIDCNLNGIPDECDLLNRTAEDCNANGQLDSCDFALGMADDCNLNGVPDECETVPDCNANGVLDSCDLDSGDSPDVNGNGIPDECDTPDTPTLAEPPHDTRKNRYISIDPRGAGGVNFGQDFDIKLTLTSTLVNGVVAIGSVWWANPPDADCLSIVGPTQPALLPNWDACPTLHLTGCPIIPTASYDIVAVAIGPESAPPLVGETQLRPAEEKWWGDAIGFFTGDAGNPPNVWTGPQGVTNFDDVNACLRTFLDPNAINATHVSVTDVHPNRPTLTPPFNQINKLVNIDDVFQFIGAFQGGQFPGPEIHLCGDP